MGLPRAVICDLDGTLAIHNGRSPYDYSRVSEDLPSPEIVTLLTALVGYHDQLLFVSGRPDSCRNDTLVWLMQFPFSLPAKLYMRKTGDKRQDTIIKREIYEADIKDKYEVLLVLDDRNRLVRMWRDLGLKCLQVADGNF